MPDTPLAIEVADVTVAYPNGHVALRDASFQLGPGTGPSGRIAPAWVCARPEVAALRAALRCSFPGPPAQLASRASRDPLGQGAGSQRNEAR